MPTTECWRDLAESRICLTPKYLRKKLTTSDKDILRTRISKYIKRGFRDTTGMVETGIFQEGEVKKHVRAYRQSGQRS